MANEAITNREELREALGEPDYSALYREDATEDEIVACYQALINNGQAWFLEGHVGRTAMAMIENGDCVLGETGHKDYWGNYVPSRTEVEPGTKGSQEYADKMKGARDGE